MANETNYSLKKSDWKISMVGVDEAQPSLFLISARDLLRGNFVDNHDIFLLRQDFYKNDAFPNWGPDNTSFNKFFKYEIDISPVKFSSLSRPYTSEKELVKLIGGSYRGSLYYQDKDAAIYPQDKRETWNYEKWDGTTKKSNWASYFRSNSNLSDNSIGYDGFNSIDMYKILYSNSSEILGNNNSDIIVYRPDDVYASSLSLDDNTKAIIGLKVNPSSEKIKKLLYGAIVLNSSNSEDNLPISESSIDYNILENLINKTLEDGVLGYNSPEEDPLNYLYFWITAPFVADYVKAIDFNQDLNQDSNVTHANILLSDKTNDTRYDEGTLPETRAYLPQNSPLKDLLVDKYMGYVGQSPTTEGLINYSGKPESRIGKTLSIYGRTLEEGQKNQYVAPITYFDPESREEASYYEGPDGLGRIPTIIGKDGNITTDGRIMSPTIDELWYVIKKLISGQKVSYDPNEEQFGEPHNDSNQKDTTLTEAIGAQYNYKYDGTSPFKADPIKMSFEKGVDGNFKLNIDEWVTQPEQTTLYSYENGRQISRLLNTFYRGLKNITEEAIPSDRDIDSIFNANKITGIFSKVNADETYGPRKSAPLSLRELEAAILGNKANIDLNTLFNSKTYAVTGMFGKREDELISESNTDRQIISGGSLYQLHRDYNAEVDNPNTWFKQNEEIIIEGNEFKYKFIHKGLGILKLFLGEEFDNLFSSIESPLFGYKKDCFYQDNGELLLFSKNGTFKNGEMKVAEISVQGATFYKLNIDLDGTGTFITDDGSTIDILYNLTSFDAEFGDTKAKGEDRDKFILDKDNTPKTDESDQQIFHNSAMPLMVEKYGTSTLLKEEQREYTGAEVFLAADGTWRRINEHVRIPVLRSRY